MRQIIDPSVENSLTQSWFSLPLDSLSGDAQKLAQAKRIRQAVSTTVKSCETLASQKLTSHLSLPENWQFPPTRSFVTICVSTTREGCPYRESCTNVHFVRALRAHTDLSLGDCSYLNTCHRMETCRYVHWVLEDPGKLSEEERTRRREGEAEKAKQREGLEKVSSNR